MPLNPVGEVAPLATDESVIRLGEGLLGIEVCDKGLDGDVCSSPGWDWDSP